MILNTMSRLLFCGVILGATILFGGCAQLTKDNYHWNEASEQVSRIDKHSTFPAVNRSSFEHVNLIELIDPSLKAKERYPAAWKLAEGIPGNQQFGVKYDLVLAYFRENINVTPQQKKIHRNSVQDRIMGISTSRCNVFKTYLRRQQSDTNFWLGSATTVAGVLGAVLPGVNASRNLAGAAGIFSGVQAEYNADYYSNLAAHVIVQGIELNQNRLQNQIIEDRQKLSIDDYSMEAAIKDAIYFDGTCSTVVGLLEASESIKETTSPGLPRAAEIIASVRAMQEISQSTNFAGLIQDGRLQMLLKQSAPKTSPLIATAVRPGYSDPALQEQLAIATLATKRVRDEIDTQAAILGDLYKQAQDKLPESSRSMLTLTVAEIKGHYTTTIASTTPSLQIQITDCVAAMATPTTAYGAANSAYLIAQDGSTEQISRLQELGIAKANAASAAARVEFLVAAAKAQMVETIEKWKPTVIKSGVTKVEILALTPTSLKDESKKLQCK
jgi:hypothetical protein